MGINLNVSINTVSLSRGCGAMNNAAQQAVLSNMASLNQMQGLDQVFQSAFSMQTQAAFQQFASASFCGAGHLPMAGNLASLQAMHFGAHAMAAGSAQFSQALQFAAGAHLAAGNFGAAAGAAAGAWLAGQGNMALAGAAAQAFGGMGGCFPNYHAAMHCVGGLNSQMQAQLALGAMAHHGQISHVSGSSTTTSPGLPASFPKAGDSPYLASLGNYKQNAKRLNVSGRHDVRTINKAIGQLRTAEPKISPMKPGDKPGPGKLNLSQAQVAAIRNAPTQAAAEAIVRDAIAGQTGQKLGTSNMNDKRGIRRNENRNALNKLLGTRVRAGREKNSGSSLVMNEMVSDIAKSVRGGSFGTTNVQQNYAAATVGHSCLGSFGVFSAGQTNAQVANGPQALSVDLSAYKDPAKTVAELYSPLIFDLEGQGLKLKNGGMIEVDLDGDGNTEMISELDAHIGLLVFDSKYEAEDGEDYGAGRDMFGNGTDLSAYGIYPESENEDATWANGFDAFRALCEHFELVHGDKQHLTAKDLKFLQDEVGLRMRVGGIGDGEDQSFKKVGITQINLGDPEQIQPIEQAEEDAYGNKLMKQEGATFVVNEETRQYADIWFNIQARVAEDDSTGFEEISSAAIKAKMRRI
jgi:hypothetical protein